MHSDTAALETAAKVFSDIEAEAPEAPVKRVLTREEIVKAQDIRDRTKRFLRVYKTIPRDVEKDERNRYILMLYRATWTLSKRQFARVAWPWLPTRPPQKSYPNWDRIRRNTRPGAR